ncbi:molybdopterin-containing oxidoreductase family protein [Raoultibacter massiliensis]|uniref:molybdopterin-containing oxidoreductase family protein n=1 Tax=Raoultibacter massiliensis TaxID=1852371 RepID=UPI000C82C537|nr:molybdopterin-dependent oxidoreductase [Raoultibacter massiliensis]
MSNANVRDYAKSGYGAESDPTVKRTRTMCTGCHNRCGVVVYSKDNKIVKILGDREHVFTKGNICGHCLSQRFIHEDESRVIYPMRRVGQRGSGEWERISWDEAMETIISKTKELQAQYGPESIIVGQGTSRSTNDWHMRLNHTLGGHAWGLAPLHVCLSPVIIPNALSFGVGQDTGADLMARFRSDPFATNCYVLWGISPHCLIEQFHVMRENQKKHGAKIISIDPRFNELSNIADIVLRPRPGTDGALAMAFMNVIIREGLYDAEWIEHWTYGFDELAQRVSEFTPEYAEKITTVPADDIAEAARTMAKYAPSQFYNYLGPNCMHSNAIQNGRAITCLIGLLGPVDQPGGYVLNPGMGVASEVELTLNPFVDLLAPESKMIGAEDYPALPVLGGTHWPYGVWNAILTEKPFPVKMLVFIASDALMCYENPQKIEEALLSPNLELLVVKDFYFSETAKLADIVLPTSTWSEIETTEDERTEGYFIPARAAVEAPGECWDDWDFILQYGKGINPEQWPWESHREMLLWKLKIMYGIEMTWDEYIASDLIEIRPHLLAENRDYYKHEKGMLRADGQPGFETATGRFEFWSGATAEFGYDPLPDYTEPAESPVSAPALSQRYPLVFDSGHRLYMFFHSAWTNVPQQRELYPDPFAVVHPDDAKDRGIGDGDWIEVESPRGSITVRAVVSDEAKKGVVFTPRPGWKMDCKELGLPGHGWKGSNSNILVPAEPCDPHYGNSPMRSTLCDIRKSSERSADCRG